MSHVVEVKPKSHPIPGIVDVSKVTIESPRGLKIWEDCPDEIKDHIRRFGMSRPGFQLALQSTQMEGEQDVKATQVEFEGGKVTKSIRQRQAPLHPYQAGTIYAMGHLARGERNLAQNILDIGSPVETTISLCAYGQVVKVDIRPANYGEAVMPFMSITGNAAKLPLGDAIVDWVVSNCVLCHVGDGRYGDMLDIDGDLNMLRECKRVLKPGGTFILGLGPVATKAAMVFNMHRTYNEEWAGKLFRWAGLKLEEFWAYNMTTGAWTSIDMVESGSKESPKSYYGFATLVRPANG